MTLLALFSTRHESDQKTEAGANWGSKLLEPFGAEEHRNEHEKDEPEEE